MSDWKRRALGAGYMIGVQWRQIRVGRPLDQVAVVRLEEDMKAGDEIVLTRSNLRFAAIQMGYDMVQVREPRERRSA